MKRSLFTAVCSSACLGLSLVQGEYDHAVK